MYVIKNRKFSLVHDLLHTWTSWHVQEGTPFYILKNLGEWETLEIVNKYVHLDADHMLSFANNITFAVLKPLGGTLSKASND